MSYQTVLTTPVIEKQTTVLTGVIQDENGSPIAASQLETFILYLYNQKNSAIINTRSGSNILNANGGTVDANGVFVLTLDSADMTLVGTDTLEIHVAQFRWTWPNGAPVKSGVHEVIFSVYNLANL